MRNLISRYLIFVGIFCIIVSSFLIWQRNTPTRLAFAIENTSPIKTSSKVPTEIVMTDLGIQLSIIPSVVEKNKWGVTDKGVSYLTSSPVPGEKGNSVLYGHNYPNLLGKLPKIKPGQGIKIKYADNSEKTFIVEYTAVVTPNQTQILKETLDTRITIYTCTGFLDSKRFVVSALLNS